MGSCFHGGGFWEAVPFDRLSTRSGVINADVLDAWFPPAPSVIDAICEMGEWGMRTSPPTHTEPLEAALREAFGVEPGCVLAGPGSSALIFAAFSRWLEPSSRVLIVEPTYGEYAHLCESVVGCRVDRFRVGWKEPFDLQRWSRVAEDYDLAILVNPNNPTGDVISTPKLAACLPTRPRVWIDEAYLAYTDQPSMASLVTERPNLAVVRSLSKSHALSGMRVAALFAHPTELAPLRPWCPPWWVSTPAQVAAVAALREEAYYQASYAETHAMREAFAGALEQEVVPGAANWILARLPSDGPTADEVVRRCAFQGLYLRDAGRTAPSLGDRTLRIAVKRECPFIAERLASVLKE